MTTEAKRGRVRRGARRERMTSEGDNQKRQKKAYSVAALTVSFFSLFALAFVGVVVMLNDYADKLDAERANVVEIADRASEDPFYVLLIGSDTRKGTAVYTNQSTQYADVITLMRIDPKDYEITFLTVPRDTVLSGNSSKICAALNSDDPLDVVKEVENLTGVKVDAYLMTTFISFENLINALGGIDVDVPQTVTMVDPATGKNVKVKKGKNQHLNGAQALVLARSREEYEGNQDALRQVNVRNIERAMVQRVFSTKDDFDVGHVLAALDEDTKSNMDAAAYGLLMKQFMEHADEVTIYDGTGTYEGNIRAGDEEWVIPEDEQAWEALMAAVNAGKDPSTVVKPPTFS